MTKLAVTFTGPVYTASDRSFLKRDYGTKEPIVDEKGLSVYQARIMTTTGGRVETLEVNVKSKTDPLAGIPPMTPATLIAPEVSFGVYQGKKYFSIWAQGIECTNTRKAQQ